MGRLLIATSLGALVAVALPAHAQVELGSKLFTTDQGIDFTLPDDVEGAGTVQRRLAGKLREKRDGHLAAAQAGITELLALVSSISSKTQDEDRRELARLLRTRTLKPMETAKRSMIQAIEVERDRLRLLRKALQAEQTAGAKGAEVDLEVVNMLSHLVENGERRNRANAIIRAWRGFGLGMASYLLGDMDPAIEKLQEAVDASPEFAELRAYLASVLLLAGKHKQGLEQWATALEISPADNVTEAEEQLKELHKLIKGASQVTDPDDRVKLAKTLRTKGEELPQIREGNVTMRQALMLDGVGKVVLELQTGRIKDVELSAKERSVITRVSHMVQAGNRLDGAKRRLRGYREFAYGLAGYLEGDLSGAINGLRRAEKDLPEIPEVYQYLGSFLYLGDQTSEALLAWRKALKLDPKNEEIKSAVESLTRAQ